MSHPIPRRLAGTAAAVSAVLAAGTLTVSPASAQQATVELQVLGINDFHGHLDPSSTAGQPSVAGILGGAVKTLRGENANTVFVSAGDNIGASPFISSSQKDEPTIDVLNAMGLAVSAVGNHEFDRGYADLAGRVVPRAQFPFLGANVEGESPALRDSHVVTTPSGVRIGFVGVVTQETGTLVSPAGIPGITFSDPVAAANRAADALSDGSDANGEADVVVLLAHEGPSTAAPAGSTNAASCAAIQTRDDAFGKIIRDTNANVDAILGGHTHLNVDCEFALPNGQVRPVLEASEYGTRMDRLKLTYDTAARRVTAASGDIVTLTASGTPATFPYATDPAIEQIVTAAKAKADEIGRQVIGRITEDVPRAKTASGAEDRGSESLLGNFIADVQLSATNGSGQLGGPAQIALMNPGGLRADLLFDNQVAGEAPGEITYSELAVVQPFANTLFTLTLTGAQLEQVLEEQYQPAGSSRPFLALGVSRGFRYTLDGTQPAGSRIANLTLNGTPIDPAAGYRIVTNSFLASGGDNFRTLASGTDRRDTGLDDLSILVAHVRASSPITPDRNDRSNVLTPCVQQPFTDLPVTTISAMATATVTITASPGSTVELLAYTRPASTYAVVRVLAVGPSGEVSTTVRPPANTRLYARQVGCTSNPALLSRVLNVRTTLTLTAKRNGPRDYTFSGDSLPARAGGLVVSLYRTTADGSQVLTAQTRANATTGDWSIRRVFTGSGRFGFQVRTGQDLQNAPGASNVRSTLVY